jgi:hypothetical protein
MAKKQATKKQPQRSGPRSLRLLCCVTIVAACVVLCIGGLEEGVRTSKIVYRCLAASAGIGLVYLLSVRAMAIYEEINGGQA